MHVRHLQFWIMVEITSIWQRYINHDDDDGGGRTYLLVVTLAMLVRLTNCRFIQLNSIKFISGDMVHKIHRKYTEIDRTENTIKIGNRRQHSINTILSLKSQQQTCSTKTHSYHMWWQHCTEQYQNWVNQ